MNYFPKINYFSNALFFLIIFFVKNINFIPLIEVSLKLFYINDITFYDFPKFILFYNLPIGFLFFIICYSLDYYFYKIKKKNYKDWKIQHKFEEENKKYIAIKMSYLNIFLLSIYFSFLTILNNKIPIFKIYTNFHNCSSIYWYFSIISYFIYLDFAAYSIHRILHFPYLYKNIHKYHHLFQQPTPFVSLALHPIEYFSLVNASLIYLIFIKTHINVVIINLLFIFIFNILNHSGIYFDSGLIMECSSKFHDDHHRYFHLNYGQSLSIWDIIFKTIRKKNIKYSKNKFFY